MKNEEKNELSPEAHFVAIIKQLKYISDRMHRKFCIDLVSLYNGRPKVDQMFLTEHEQHETDSIKSTSEDIPEADKKFTEFRNWLFDFEGHFDPDLLFEVIDLLASTMRKGLDKAADYHRQELNKYEEKYKSFDSKYPLDY